MTKLLIYDCDGVLFNSRNAVLAYYDYVCETFNLEKIDKNNETQVKDAMMKTNTEIIDMLTSDKIKKEEILEFANNMNFKRFLHLMKPELNLFKALERLHRMKMDMSIFTNRGKSLHYLLEHYEIHSYFDFRITSFEVKNAKPHPEGLFRILDHYSKSPDECLYIGDSSTDYFAAKEAGVPFIAFANELYDAPLIKDHNDIFNFLDT